MGYEEVEDGDVCQAETEGTEGVAYPSDVLAGEGLVVLGDKGD